VNQQNTVTLTPTLNQPSTDAALPNGNGRTISGGTGACVAEPGFSASSGGYWDIGVRGDTSPTSAGTQNSQLNPTLVPAYSVISSGPYSGSNNNVATDPTMISQYCNGARVPPENLGAGYNVPPGIADATVPNPLFDLTPVATVDEGNNWINIQWGPLTLVNTSNGSLNGTTLGDYGLTSTSTSAINHIPSSATAFFNAAPSTDFYGNPRKAGSLTTTAVDAGAVEYTTAAAQGGGAQLSVTGGTVSFGNVPVGTTSAVQTIVVSNTGDAAATAGVTVTFTGPTGLFTRATGAAAGSCGATALVAGASCTIGIVFSPTTATNNQTGTAIVSSTPAVNDSPVSLTGNGVPQLIAATVSPASVTMTSPNNCNATNGGASCALQAFTLTNTGNVPVPTVGAGALSGTGSGSYSVVTLFSTCGVAPYTTLAVGQGCTVTVKFQPTAIGSTTATLTVPTTGVPALNNHNTAAISGNSQ